jgi:sentrin-specific protease 1
MTLPYSTFSLHLKNNSEPHPPQVNAYMFLLQERDARFCLETPGRLPTHFFNSFFFTKMFEHGDEYRYGSVRRWASKVALLYP